MPAKVGPTLRVLMEIRGELREIREEAKGTNARLTSTNARLEAVEQGLEVLSRRQTETEIRLASELVAVVKSVGEVTKAVSGLGDLLRARLDDRERVDDHERRITELERHGQ
ncbi:MAG: hypothetical protein HYY06_10700 [Deltaproteobacteria bacterium]|nr:hypothetical protein [Deltaproteobacteria bacterium]